MTLNQAMNLKVGDEVYFLQSAMYQRVEVMEVVPDAFGPVVVLRFLTEAGEVRVGSWNFHRLSLRPF